jgi:signal transduction histidine kinase
MVETQAQEKNIEIEKSLASEPLEAVVDADRMSQVLLNLYLNAMQSMEEKGTVHHSFGRKDLSLR